MKGQHWSPAGWAMGLVLCNFSSDLEKIINSKTSKLADDRQ